MSNRIMAASIVAALAAGGGAATATAAKPDHVRDAEWGRGGPKGEAKARSRAVAAVATQKERAELDRERAQWAQSYGNQWARGVAAAEARARAAAVHAALVERWSHYDGVAHFGDAPAPLHSDSAPGGHGGT